ncbi:MAG: AsmA family protein, partial [Beijerinckiaceae bacterium]|nr:AsmA family protein [Beijerinckiaceae bacterium]
MQTTLLGLAIAFILALLAALVGPFFIDWSQFRTQFEREVARATGMQVRVDGRIDARLLPSPTLSQRDVAIGERLDANNLSVEKLDVEVSLGDLMRGQWRATELSLTGLVLEVGLDDKGRMKWNAAPGNFNLAAVTVDRFSVTGAIAVLDAASNTSFRFDNIAFGGEVRGLAGSLRGEGAVTFRGTRYPFRLATGRVADANALRVRLNVDSLNTGFGVDLD